MTDEPTEIAPAEEAAPEPPGGRRLSHPLVRGGLALSALAGALDVAASGGDLITAPARAEGGGTISYAIDDVPNLSSGLLLGLGAAAVVLIGAAAVVPRLWARLAGLFVATAIAATSGLIVLSARLSEDVAIDADITLERAGVLLALAFWVGIAGVLLALYGVRAEATTEAGEPAIPRRRPGGDSARPATAPKAMLALVFALGGFLVPALGTVGVALGTLALGEVRDARGRLGGRGIAMGAVVVGIIVLALLMAFVGVQTLVATPQ